MATNDLVLAGQTFSVQRVPLFMNCQTFVKNPALLMATYQVQSPVAADILRTFLSAVEGATPELTIANAPGLALLCDEFGFTSLAEQVSEFESRHSSIDEHARRIIAALKDQLVQQNREICVLHEEAGQHRSQLARHLQIIEQLSAANTSQQQQSELARLTRIIEELSAATLSLRWQVESQQREIAALKAESSRSRADVQQELADLRERVSGLAAVGKLFFPKEQAPLDGIISYLTRKCGGNVHDRGVIGTTASSENGSGYGAKQAVEPGSDGHQFLSNDRRDSWLCFDFKGMWVIPTHYSILSSLAGVSHPKQWCLEVSTDGKQWTEIDRRNNNDLNGNGLTATYTVSQQVRSKYVRMRLTGQSHDKDHILMLRRLEIFGTLIED
jgi:hypothetical protein